MVSSGTIELAPLARTSTLTLSAPGRKSGQPRSVTIWFVVVEDQLYVGSLRDDRNWIRNARAAGSVGIKIGDAVLHGNFTAVREELEIGAVRTALRSKYLAARIAGWFGVRQRFVFRIDALERPSS